MEHGTRKLVELYSSPVFPAKLPAAHGMQIMAPAKTKTEYFQYINSEYFR